MFSFVYIKKRLVAKKSEYASVLHKITRTCHMLSSLELEQLVVYFTFFTRVIATATSLSAQYIFPFKQCYL